MSLFLAIVLQEKLIAAPYPIFQASAGRTVCAQFGLEVSTLWPPVEFPQRIVAEFLPVPMGASRGREARRGARNSETKEPLREVQLSFPLQGQFDSRSCCTMWLLQRTQRKCRSRLIQYGRDKILSSNILFGISRLCWSPSNVTPVSNKKLTTQNSTG